MPTDKEQAEIDRIFGGDPKTITSSRGGGGSGGGLTKSAADKLVDAADISLDGFVADKRFIWGDTKYVRPADQIEGAFKSWATFGTTDPDAEGRRLWKVNHEKVMERAKIMTMMSEDGVYFPPHIAVAGGTGTTTGGVLSPFG